MNTFQLKIITPEKLVFSGDVESLTVPQPSGLEGYLSNHAPTLAPIIPGRAEYTLPSGKKDSLEIPGGYLDFSDNQATLFLIE